MCMLGNSKIAAAQFYRKFSGYGKITLISKIFIPTGTLGFVVLFSVRVVMYSSRNSFSSRCKQISKQKEAKTRPRLENSASC